MIPCSIFFDRNQLATHSSAFLKKLGGGLKTALFAGSRSGSKWRINSGACCCLRLAFSTAMVLISAMILTIVLLTSSRSNRKKSRFFCRDDGTQIFCKSHRVPCRNLCCVIQTHSRNYRATCSVHRD